MAAIIVYSQFNALISFSRTFYMFMVELVVFHFYIRRITELLILHIGNIFLSLRSSLYEFASYPNSKLSICLECKRIKSYWNGEVI